MLKDADEDLRCPQCGKLRPLDSCWDSTCMFCGAAIGPDGSVLPLFVPLEDFFDEKTDRYDLDAPTSRMSRVTF